MYYFFISESKETPFHHTWLSQEWTMCCSASHSGPVPCHGLCLLVKLEYITAMCWEHVNQKVFFLCYSQLRRIKTSSNSLFWCVLPLVWLKSLFVMTLIFLVLLFYFQIVPSCVAFQFLLLCDFPTSSVFSVPFPHLSFARLPPPAPHRLISVWVCVCECVVFVRPLCFSPASSSIILAFLLLTSRYVLVLCSLCFHWFVRLHFV